MEPRFKEVVIAGAGGVGFWIGVLLCRMLRGIATVTIYDDDTFEGGNGFRRLPKAAKESMHKVDLLKVWIPFVMGDMPPIVHKRRLLPDDFDGDWSGKLVVDATDMDQERREAFWDALTSAGAVGIRVSYDGLGIATISPGPPMMPPGVTDGGYAIMPTIAQSFTAAGMGASAVIYTLYTGKVLEFDVHVPTPETESVVVEVRGTALEVPNV